jgi:dipeptidyl-peptidase-4
MLIFVDIQYATLAPVGNTIAFVRGNNLFIWSNGTTTQITKDGSPDLFNGVPDWVYEEEIFSSNNVLWFSPDGASLAYLKIDETGVCSLPLSAFVTKSIRFPPTISSTT